MRRGLAALAAGWMLAAGCVWAQTGYQSQPIAPDPALKSVQIPESVLMRAAYEARREDCVDARKHLDDVQKDRPRWAPVFATRLICARSEGQAMEERAALNALMTLQPRNWRWWRDSAALHGQAAELQAAESDMGQAILLRPWDADLYAQRSEWRERQRDYAGAYADAARMHELEPALGAPLERMARLAERAGHSATEAQQEHALAELNPENLPLAARDDSDLPVGRMMLQELLLRASYALRIGNGKLALKLTQVTLQRWPGTGAALEMYYPLWKGGFVEVDAARDAMWQLAQIQQEGMTAILAAQDAAQTASRRPGTTAHSAPARRTGPAAVVRPEYYRWLLEMGVSDWEQLQLYRQLIALDPYEARNYADLAGVQLRGTTPHGAIESSPPRTVAGLNGVPPLPSGNPANQAARPMPSTKPQPLPDPVVDGSVGGTAEENYRRAIELDASEPAYYYGLAQALDRRSAFPLEIMALNMALTGDPDNADYKAARAKLP